MKCVLKDIICEKIRITTFKRYRICIKLYKLFKKTSLLLNKLVISVKQHVLV